VLDDLDEPHHRELFNMLNELHSGGAHLIATNSNEMVLRPTGGQLASDRRRVRVAGDLSGDKQNLTHRSTPVHGL
jgi:hypothetical protein